MAKRLHLTWDVGENVIPGVFFDEALRRGFQRFASDSWPTSAKLEPPPEGWTSVEPQAATAVFELASGALGSVHVAYGTAFGQAAAETDEAARAGIDELREAFPRSARIEEGRVPVTFWSYSPHGPVPMRRELFVPEWQEIAGNYPERVRTPLARLMRGDMGWRGGQLILWHGETGTGKTTALRALAREWSSWCEAHYITDPEKFFGDQADYMMSVMLEEDEFDDDEGEELIAFEAHRGIPRFAAIAAQSGTSERKNAMWRLLVLEDTGELLSADARAKAGQGLSRFLNVVDGLIGQGLRILVLVTTNEEIGKLHPAVARPGRCAASVLFPRLSREEANAWLAERGHDTTASGPMTLAALYALVEGWDAVAERQAIGFG